MKLASLPFAACILCALTSLHSAKAQEKPADKPTEKPAERAQQSGSIFDVTDAPSSSKGTKAKVKPTTEKESDKAAGSGIFDDLSKAKPVERSPNKPQNKSAEKKPTATATANTDAADDDSATNNAKPKPSDEQEAVGVAVEFAEQVVEVEVAVDAMAEEDFIVEEGVLLDGFAGGAQVNDPVFTKSMQHLAIRKALATRCAELTEEQSQALDLLNEQWMKEQLAEAPAPAANNGLLFGVMRMFGANPAGARVQPRQEGTRKVYKAMAAVEAAVKAALDGPQLEAYEGELDAHLEFRKEAHAALYTALIEEHIFLTEEQRVELLEKLAKSLKAEEQIYFQFYFQNNQQFLPSIPTAAREVLDKDQMKILSSINTYTYDAVEWEMQMIPHQPLIVIEEN